MKLTNLSLFFFKNLNFLQYFIKTKSDQSRQNMFSEYIIVHMLLCSLNEYYMYITFQYYNVYVGIIRQKSSIANCITL